MSKLKNLQLLSPDKLNELIKLLVIFRNNRNIGEDIYIFLDEFNNPFLVNENEEKYEIINGELIKIYFCLFCNNEGGYDEFVFRNEGFFCDENCYREHCEFEDINIQNNLPLNETSFCDNCNIELFFDNERDNNICCNKCGKLFCLNCSLVHQNFYYCNHCYLEFFIINENNENNNLNLNVEFEEDNELQNVITQSLNEYRPQNITNNITNNTTNNITNNFNNNITISNNKEEKIKDKVIKKCVKCIVNEDFNCKTCLKYKEKECKICYINKSNHIIFPCGHKCICGSCLNKVKKENNKCPFCNGYIEKIFDI